MGLSDDQRALLRLLAQREEGYEDIAALKGLSVEQVRAEVKDALAEMQAASETPPSRQGRGAHPCARTKRPSPCAAAGSGQVEPAGREADRSAVATRPCPPSAAASSC